MVVFELKLRSFLIQQISIFGGEGKASESFLDVWLKTFEIDFGERL